LGALGTHRAASSGDGYQSEGPTQPIRPTQPVRPTRPTRPMRARRRSRIAVRMAKILFAVVLVVAAAVGLLFALTPSAGQATALARAQAQDRHIAYPGPAVPPYFAQALIATEDHRFNTDPGVDPVALGRVAINWILGRQDQGGSTIDQQLAKNLYTGGHSGFTEDLEQLALAVKLNQAYSRAQILRMYAEVAYYGHGYYGLDAASCGYFGRRGGERAHVRRPAGLPGAGPDPAGARHRPDGRGGLPDPGAGDRGAQRAARPVRGPRLPVIRCRTSPAPAAR